MNPFQSCTNTSDAVPLYLPQHLYLKPISRLNISIQLPNVKKLGKSISHWEIMENLRTLIKPDEFAVLKVTKTTLEFVRLEAEVEVKNKVDKVVSKLHNKMIKLKDFSDLLRVKAGVPKSDFPNRQIWDEFFQNAKDMDEMKPGERPDTLHLSNLPTKWFVAHPLANKEDMPSEKIFYRIFEKFGKIRYVDIPICDPHRKKMKDHISGIKYNSFDNTEYFEGYVQFKDYTGFTRTMDTLRDMKLMRKDDDEAIAINIRVEFDKSKHLSDASIRRREIVRERLVKKAKEKEEKEKLELEDKKREEKLERQKEVDEKTQKELRRKLREEKRKAKLLEKLEITGSEEINDKIAKEEKKLLKVQRKLEAIRLVEELFRRIKEKQQDDVDLNEFQMNAGHDELKKLKNTSELAVLNQREKLHHVIKGRAMLKTILSDKKRRKTYSSSSDSSLSLDDDNSEGRKNKHPINMELEPNYEASWYDYSMAMPAGMLYPPPRIYHPHMGKPNVLVPYPGPSRGYNRRSRGFNPRYRGGHRGGRRLRYPPELQEQYQKYFSKFLNEHDDRRGRSDDYDDYKRSRSYSRSYSRSPKSRRSRSRTRSKNNRSRSYSRSRSRSRSRRRSYTRSRSRSRRRSRSKSKRKENGKEKTSGRTKSKSREKSVDSSKFMTPKQLKGRSRSKSWSLPRESDKNKERSWSKSPIHK